MQSLDSSCELACLRERIQKSQEEKERKGDPVLHSHTLLHIGRLCVMVQIPFNAAQAYMFVGLFLLTTVHSLFCTLSVSGSDAEEEEEEMMCSTDPSRFVTDPDFGYQEFARREEDHFQVFRVQVRTLPLH